jgi:hypothetical protein
MEEPYSKREQDEFRTDVREKLEQILEQTTEHNHRMSKIERWILVVGTATAVLITLKFPELTTILRLI